MDKIKEFILKLIDRIWEILSKYLGQPRVPKDPRLTEIGATAIEDVRQVSQQIEDAVIVREGCCGKCHEPAPVKDACCSEDCDCDGDCGDDCKCRKEDPCVCGDEDCEAKDVKIIKKKVTKMRKVYHVVPGPKGGWLVKEEKNKNPSARADRKPEAVARAKELAKKAKLGQVIVHKKNGQIQTEYTYGKDPRSTKG